MDLIEALILISTILQAIVTGSFLCLDISTKSLQTTWGFSTDKMVKVGTIGYSLGFLITALYSLFISKISPKITILIGGLLTSLSWLGIYFSLCHKCVTWEISMILEAGVCSGTSLSYMSAATIITESNNSERRKVKLIILALFVAVGSIIAFLIFIDLDNIKTVILIMLGFSILSTILVFLSSFLYIKETMLLFPNEENPEVKFSGSFFLYLFSLNISFGIIMTFINNGNGLLDSFEQKWNNQNTKTQLPLICFVIGNLVGRFTGIFLKNYLEHILFLFSFFSFVITFLSSFLLIYWRIELVFAILCASSVFFGLIWTLSMPLARSFFSIREDRSLGMIFVGASIGPVIFGLSSSWLYHYHHLHSHVCDYRCYWVYLCLSTMACFATIITYVCSWYKRGNERIESQDRI
jgi:MFS family permease